MTKTTRPNKLSKRFYGHPLSSAEIKQLGKKLNPKWVIFSPCRCTWDSPTSPCICPDNIYLKVLKSDIIDSGKFDSKNKDQQLNYYDVKKKSKFIIQSGIKPVIVKTAKGKQSISFKLTATFSPVTGNQQVFDLRDWLNDLIQDFDDLADTINNALENSGVEEGIGGGLDIIGIIILIL